MNIPAQVWSFWIGFGAPNIPPHAGSVFGSLLGYFIRSTFPTNSPLSAKLNHAGLGKVKDSDSPVVSPRKPVANLISHHIMNKGRSKCKKEIPWGRFPQNLKPKKKPKHTLFLSDESIFDTRIIIILRIQTPNFTSFSGCFFLKIEKSHVAEWTHHNLYFVWSRTQEPP